LWDDLVSSRSEQETVVISIDPDAPAFLIWLPEDVTASAQDFHLTQSWTLEQAAEQAYEASKDHSKRPWIMTEGVFSTKMALPMSCPVLEQ
jgi:hypothetical protein